MTVSTVPVPGRCDDSPVAPAAIGHTFAQRVVLLDVLLFALFTFDRFSLGRVPAGVALAALVVGVATLRRPTARIRYLGLMVVGYGCVLAYLLTVSLINDGDPWQRLLRFAILGAMAWALAEGRMDAFSAVLGVVLGLFVNAAAFYSGITPRDYGEFLTGWLGDKNVAGLWYSVFGVLGLWLWRSRRVQVLWVGILGALVFLTGSRTSMSAMLAALMWVALRNRLSVLGRLGLGGLLFLGLQYAEENLARIGMFANRDGTDWFREQIAFAVDAKLAGTPWYGLGLGEARVVLDNGRPQFFHDSYAALRVEGGWPLLVVWVGMLLLVAGGVFVSGQVSAAVRYGEGALVAILVCAWKLGEVFFTSAAFIVLGFLLWARFAQSLTEEERDRWTA